MNEQNDFLKLLEQKYAPAQSVEEATDFLSTYEIYYAISTMCEAQKFGISADKIFLILKEKGYKFGIKPLTTFEVRWLLKKK